MKTIIENHKIPYFDSKQFRMYYEDMRLGVFDIETLGLNPSYCPMILAGFMVVNGDGSVMLKQHFAETPEEEPLLLAKLAEDFTEVDYVLTYNGKHFDIPFVEKRSQRCRFKSTMWNIHNLDLYLVLNGHSDLKHQLKNLKQKTVEEYMGLVKSRDDLITGAESVKLYEEFVSCQDASPKAELEKKILLHNHDDLLQLYQLLPVLKKSDIHKAMYSLGFPIKGLNGWPTLNIYKIKISNTSLVIEGKYSGTEFSYMSYETFGKSYSCRFNDDNTFTFSLNIIKHKGNLFIHLPYFLADYEELTKFPNYTDDFIIAVHDGKINHMEVNSFIKSFFREFMNETSCPI